MESSSGFLLSSYNVSATLLPYLQLLLATHVSCSHVLLLLPFLSHLYARLCIWRLVRSIIQRPPPIELRKSLGPGFVSSRGGGYGDAVYNRNNPPALPSYMTVETQTKWINRTQFNSLAQYCMEMGLVQVRCDALACYMFFRQHFAQCTSACLIYR